MDTAEIAHPDRPTAAAKPLISVVIPVYNEEANVAAAHAAVADVFGSLAERYDFEIIFTDNHSLDATFERILAIAKSDQRVRAVRFARNFGFQRSVMTGYRLARGDAAIQIDCDLQDPPAIFPQFLALWEQGHDVVVGIRRFRDESKLLQWSRKLYYRLLKAISSDNLMLDSGDFRLVDRSILDQLRRIDDASPYTRGLTSLLASNQTGVPYERAVREKGQSKFPLVKLIGLAVDGFVAHSTTPLRMASFAGLLIALATALASVFYILGRLFFGTEWPEGFATTTILILFGISLNAIFLGVIGEYVGRIYEQIRVRPTTVIERSINMMPSAESAPRKYSAPDRPRTMQDN
ncbi:dolichol-phosphate mannosyltransferase [Bradyrhizobium lablabi]|uniref:Dolichol-phosphate mannosyltransferase n=1 Tax=Bradyrhizobium lablabi TaxID=722472 RepID=A0A1M7BE23_9BRAD|nr:glycosyltransferase family 2 protein [Bradyrhizobium lablabi]SHL53181.1 dolichol-phosphate mannosyltransferase [Bradyrhizobium lablabi]